MTKLEEIERNIAALSPAELARLRDWFEQHEADALDRRIERDAFTGRLDHLAEAAQATHSPGEAGAL